MPTTGNCRLFSAPLLVASLLLASAANAVDQGPWSVASAAPVTNEAATTRGRVGRAVEPEGLPARAALGFLSFYQTYLSPLDGSHCPMLPTCSRYAVESIREHGPLAGFILTADRLLHEADEQRLAPRIKVGNRYQAVDPVSANDWWFRGQ